MTLAALLRHAGVQLRLDMLAPPMPPRAPAPLLAPPSEARPSTIAAALSYLLRFELERRYPLARTHDWLAEDAPGLLESLAPELVARAEAAGEDAGQALAVFAQERAPGPESRAWMAAHALRLARLDAVVRSGYVDPRMDAADAADVADLLAMLDATPWASFVPHGAQLDLNPSFGRASVLVPGADADAIIDGRLYAFRTSKSDRIGADDVRPLVLRFLLSRLARADDASFPEVREIGLLSARHGSVWSAPVKPMLEHAGFPAIESWMLRHMERERGLTLKSIAKGATLDDAPAPKTLQRTPGWVKKRWGRGKRAPQTAPEGKADKKKAER